MSNPTDRYGISFPAENADPWYAAFADAYQTIDTTVSSVEQLARKLASTTLVISYYQGGVPVWTASSTLPNAANSTVLSASPYGRLAGSFTVPCSGCNVLLALEMPMFATGSAVAADITVKQFFRVVDANSVNLTGDSAWTFTHRAAALWTPLRFTAIASLGAGTYTVELQQRALWSGANPSSSTSPAGYGILWATPMGR